MAPPFQLTETAIDIFASASEPNSAAFVPPLAPGLAPAGPESLVKVSASAESELVASTSGSPTNNAMLQIAPTSPGPEKAAPKKPSEVYKIVTQVGEGTFGKVYKAHNQLTDQYVALKRIRMEGEKDGFPVTAMREIKLLQSLQHKNVVPLHEMMVSRGRVSFALQML